MIRTPNRPVVGVVGGGQLGRMLALAGYPLGITCLFLEPSDDPPAGQVAEVLAGAYDDVCHLERMAEIVDVVTYELEGVPVEPLRKLGDRVSVQPPLRALAATQDRVLEKQTFEQLGVPTAAWMPIDRPGDVENAISALGVPLVLKRRRGGYDGRGQTVVHSVADIGSALGAHGEAPLMAEAMVGFDREVSLIGVRGQTGEFSAYPLVENVHRDGILRHSVAPAAGWPGMVQAEAERYVRRIMEELAYVGVLTVEFFDVGGRLLANEMAPRVHNSGHWTIEGAETSQFENHLRAILGLPLGSTSAVGHSIMINLIGTVPNPAEVLRVPGASLHLYGKDPRPGRKLGHITVCARMAEEAHRRAALVCVPGPDELQAVT